MSDIEVIFQHSGQVTCMSESEYEEFQTKLGDLISEYFPDEKGWLVTTRRDTDVPRAEQDRWELNNREILEVLRGLMAEGKIRYRPVELQT